MLNGDKSVSTLDADALAGMAPAVVDTRAAAAAVTEEKV